MDGRPGRRRGRRRPADPGWRPPRPGDSRPSAPWCLRGNMSTALRLAGQVGRAAELIDPVISHADPTRTRTMPIHNERASLDMLRGRCAEALARFDRTGCDADRCSRRTGSRRPSTPRARPLVRSAARRPSTAWWRCSGNRWRPPPRPRSGADLALAARAAADVADASGASDAARQELLGQLQRLHDQAADRPVRPRGLLPGPAGTRGGLGRRDGATGRAGPRWSCGPRPPATGTGSAGRTTRRTAGGAARRSRWPPARAPPPPGCSAGPPRDAREHVPLSTAIAETSGARARGTGTLERTPPRPPEPGGRGSHPWSQVVRAPTWAATRARLPKRPCSTR